MNLSNIKKIFKNKFPSTNWTSRMLLVKSFDNVKIFARKEENFNANNYIYENKIHRDGTIKEHLCLLPNYNRIYFEIMFDNNFNKRAGFSKTLKLNSLDDFEKVTKEYVENNFLKDFLKREYFFKNWSNIKEKNKIEFLNKIN